MKVRDVIKRLIEEHLATSRAGGLNLKEYAVIYESGKSNWSAYSPDVPGCVATGRTCADVEIRFKEALQFHLEGLRLHSDSIPEPCCEVGMVAVAA
jgi:Uncharacterized conserved protein